MRYSVRGHVLSGALALSLAPGSIYGGLPHSGNVISQEMQQTLVAALETRPPLRMIEVDPFIPESVRKELKTIFKQIHKRGP
jgi:hypothetical protein